MTSRMLKKINKSKSMDILIENIKMIRRGLIIIAEISPKIIRINIIKEIITSLTPYIAICMSALIIDELAGDRDLQLIITYILITTAGTLILNIIDNVFETKKNNLNMIFGAEFKSYLNNVKLNLDYSKLDDPKYNELHSKIAGTMFMVNGGITSVVDLLTKIISNIISVTIAAVIILRSFITSASGTEGFNWRPLLTVFLYIAVIAGSIALTVRNSKIESKKVFELYQNCSTNRYIDYYHFNYMEDDKAAKDIRIFSQRDLIVNEIKEKARKPWMKILLDSAGLAQKYFGFNVIISAFIGGFTYIVIGLRALNGSISLGSVTSSYASTVILISAIGNLFVSISQIISNNNYLKVLYEYLDIPDEGSKGTLLPESKDNCWLIEFHNVSFKYPALDEYALKNISFQLSSNSQTAVVGVNGSGKTTMIKLLCGFYRPDEGYISLNGIKIDEYDREEYLKLFSVVFQDFKIFAFSIGENVAASKDYDTNKVWDALNKSGLSDKIEKLPEQIEQFIYKDVRTDGVDLSGGEEQKLAISRALYKDAPFIIFDEPTAALDPVAEYEIYTKFNQIIDDKAAIFISHRLSSCRFCKDILVFDGGRIVQRGAHDKLIENEEGKYYQLWNAQAQYYNKK